MTRKSKREIETAIDRLDSDNGDRVRAWFEALVADGWDFLIDEPADAVTVVRDDAGEWSVSREDLPEFIDEGDLPVDLGVNP
jgi:hypothetical protein